MKENNLINKSKSETTILGIVILFDYMFRPFLIRPSSGRRYFVEETVKYIQSVPLQAWSGPEGSRKLRFPDFMTTAKVVRLSALRTGRIYPQEILMVLISVRG